MTIARLVNIGSPSVPKAFFVVINSFKKRESDVTLSIDRNFYKGLCSCKGLCINNKSTI